MIAFQRTSDSFLNEICIITNCINRFMSIYDHMGILAKADFAYKFWNIITFYVEHTSLKTLD
jgi:hypothetical protein